MLLNLLFRLARADSAGDRAGITTRLEVCPPALRRPSPGRRLRAWLRWPLRAAARNAGAAASLPRTKHDFVRQLADIRNPQSRDLQWRIDEARSLRELWHLRSAVFEIVAVEIDQQEAQCRLARLNVHFPTRSPRSGLVPFDPLSAHEPR